MAKSVAAADFQRHLYGSTVAKSKISFGQRKKLQLANAQCQAVILERLYG
jgi:hypothetical protein